MKLGAMKYSLVLAIASLFSALLLPIATPDVIAQETLPTLAPDPIPEMPATVAPSVPGRAVQPTQTQPAYTQPQPLAPALPYNTSDPLKPGDLVSIDVLGFQNLSGQQQVSSAGTVQLPLGGAIFVGGYAPLEAIAPITQALLPYVKRPQVSVALVNASPIRISVSGEVQSPGPRLLDPQNSETQAQRLPPTLSTALVESGGITPSADLRNIVIRRPVAGRAPDGASGYSEFQVNLWEAVSSGDLGSDPRIFNGDEIIVPAADIADIDQRTLLTSTIAPEQITVQVAGEVTSPGQLQVSPLVGVSGAVAAAGGPTVDADTEEVVVLRMMPDGRVEQLLYTFGEASEPLIEGDVVFVEASGRGGVGNMFDFIGRILNPFGALVDLFN